MYRSIQFSKQFLLLFRLLFKHVKEDRLLKQTNNKKINIKIAYMHIIKVGGVILHVKW